MKKVLILLALLFGTVWAEVINEPPSKALMQKEIPVIDIRTPDEWKQTGVLKGSILIMFYDKKGDYDLKKFLKELNAKVDTKKPYALLCLSGSRTSILASYLAQTYGHTIYNLEGGILAAYRAGLPLVEYK